MIFSGLWDFFVCMNILYEQNEYVIDISVYGANIDTGVYNTLNYNKLNELYCTFPYSLVSHSLNNAPFLLRSIAEQIECLLELLQMLLHFSI